MHSFIFVADVMILTSVFEQFREVCLKKEVHGLDPARYVSSPQLSWDAMLKKTGANVDLISDPAMFQMIDGGIRGGVCMISQRFAKANNKEMGSSYDPTKPTIYIPYLDANNLYGWGMSESLPNGNFTWFSEDEWRNIDWTTIETDGTFGYIIECDLEYPPEIHDEHNDYPLAPERIAVDMKMVSEKQLEILRHYDRSRNKENIKLVPNLLNKTKYCVHFRLLKFYLTHGMKLQKIHRVIRFEQTP